MCVDDFEVEYYSKDGVQHLIDVIQKQYTCKVDWKGNNFLGLTLNWEYEKGYVEISMLNYIQHALQRLQYKTEVYPQYSPHYHASIKYTTQPGRQYATKDDDNPLLLPKETNYI